MSDNRSLTRDTSRLMFAKMAAFAVTFALPLVMVRHLTQHDFGVYRQLFLLVNTSLVVLPFGFVMSAFYFLPRAGNRGIAVVTNIVAVYAGIAAISGAVLLLRPAVLSAIFNDPDLSVFARPLAAVLFLSVASSFVDLLALARGDVKSAVMFVIATNTVKTLLLGTAVVAFGSVRAILLASIVHGVLQSIFLFGYLRHGFGSLFARVDKVLLREQLAYALPLGVAGWLYWLQMESHHYFVARAFGPATYAIYAIGCASLPLTSIFGESMASVLIHRVSQLKCENRRDDIVVLLGEGFRNLAAFYLPLFGLLFVSGRDLIAVIYTPKFVASWPIFAINLTLLPLAILSTVSDAVIRSYTECRMFLLWLRLVLVCLLLPGLFFLTPRYGPIAAVSIMVGTNLIERLLVAGRIARALELRRRDVVVFKGLIAITGTVFIAGAAAWIVNRALGDVRHGSALAITVAVYITLYLSVSLIRALSSSEHAPLDAVLTILPDVVRRPVDVWLTRSGRPREVIAGPVPDLEQPEPTV